MNCSTFAAIVVIIISTVKCEWVEIPQREISPDKEKAKNTKLSDITSYILTTTSTTLATPILSKPTTFTKKRLNSNPKDINSTTNMKNNKTVIFISSKVSSVTSQSRNNTKSNFKQNNHHNLPNINVARISTLKDNGNIEEIVDEHFYDDHDNLEDFPSEQREDNDYGYSYASFIPYMSTVQSTLMKNAHKNKKSKMNILKNLRDHLLTEIRNRITALWQPAPKNREAREYKEESHIDFPSNEGALMTIGFLTFAVFLIKLVLQLIQTMSNNMNNNNGTTTTTFIGRKRRSAILDGDAIKILNYIDQYPLK